MDYIRCPLCDSDAYTRLYSCRDYNMRIEGLFHVVRCGECRLVYLNPVPCPEEIPHYYPPHAYHSKSDLRLGSKVRIFKRYRAVEERGALLDVGCGYPLFLNTLKKEGWTVRGLDTSPEVAAWAQGDFGIELDAVPASDAQYPEEFFDVITFWHSLEHMQQPRQVIQRLAQSLRHDGMFIVSVPNIQSVQARVFQGKWYHVDAPRHRCQFSRATLKDLFSRIGYREQAIDYRLFADTYAGWLLSCLNMVGVHTAPQHALSQKLRDMRWIASVPVKLIAAIPALLLSYCEELLGTGASMTVVFTRKGT